MAAESCAASSAADQAAAGKVRQPTGSVCKYCLRVDTTPNPLVHMRHLQSTLPWRREFGCECSICPAAMKQHEEYKTMDPRKIAEENAADKAKHEKFMSSCIRPYEQRKNELKGGRVSRGQTRKVSTQVKAKAWDTVEYKRVIGVVWPVAVYTEAEGSPPARKLVRT